MVHVRLKYHIFDTSLLKNHLLALDQFAPNRKHNTVRVYMIRYIENIFLFFHHIVSKPYNKNQVFRFLACRFLEISLKS